MKWKIATFWMLVFAGILSFFCLFNPFIFSQQEEVQLFIPEWYLIKERLLIPGGFYGLVGQSLAQFYKNIDVACFINALIYCLIGILFYLLLQKITSCVYHLFIALIPVFALLKIQLNPSFVLDGAIGFLFMIFFLYLSLLFVKSKWSYLILAITSFFIYYLLGQLVVLYAVLFVFLCFLTRENNWYYSFGILALGCIFSYTGVRMALYIPLTDGVYSLRYQESQLSPESFLNYVWIRLTVLSFILFLIGFLFKKIVEKKELPTWITFLIVGAGVIGYGYYALPDLFDKQNRVLGQLAYMEKQQDWNGILQVVQKEKDPGNINLNYLNMALAKKGELADKMFTYDQKGVQSLIMSWNGTYYLSALFSDIYLMTGNLSVSESYAMEAQTLAKRGGSPRALKNLIEINCRKGDYEIVNKYLNLLRKMPGYASWAEKKKENCLTQLQMQCVHNSFGNKDKLLSLLDMETLWRVQLDESSFNQTAFEYLACSYLLAKDIDKFKTLIEGKYDIYIGKALPVHFQEALALWKLENKTEVLEDPHIGEEYMSKFDQFRKYFIHEASHSDGYFKLQSQYGDTYWFYYYCKQL
ncbi:MAG: DUF6057 family protein [Massilibacteroides sp.]|nr:DUF6057 family protein [Massilibacteroides sp.]MDD3062622.1 DUF6057 family protein [Massilibacteroides sp.]MDD4659550.1 DUF6057 family protein [Massilibacteroides sp.]